MSPLLPPAARIHSRWFRFLEIMAHLAPVAIGWLIGDGLEHALLRGEWSTFAVAMLAFAGLSARLAVCHRLLDKALAIAKELR